MDFINIPSYYEREHLICARGFFCSSEDRQPNKIELKKELVSILRAFGVSGVREFLPDYSRYLFVGTGV